MRCPPFLQTGTSWLSETRTMAFLSGRFPRANSCVNWGAALKHWLFSKTGRPFLPQTKKSINEEINTAGRHSLHLRCWQVDTGKEVRHQPLLAADADKTENLITSLFSPDGKILASFHNLDESTIVYFWEAASGKKLHHQSLGKRRIQRNTVAFSPDSRLLALSSYLSAARNPDDGMVHLWEATTGKEVRQWTPDETGTFSLTFSPDGGTLASAGVDGSVRLWEVATGRERCRFAGHHGEVWCVAFAPDGRRLATGSNDTSILVWDVTGRLHRGRLQPVRLSPQEVKSLWASLADTDAARASQAMWSLAAAPEQTLPLLKEYFRLIPTPSRIVRLIANLDSEVFAVRQNAIKELEKLGKAAEPALWEALAKSESLDMRRRLEQLLEPLGDKFPLVGEQLHSCRALELLGQMDTPEARLLLESLAQGAPGIHVTRNARAVLQGVRTRVGGTKP
jgi:WD domain, G-beta repeat